MTASTGNRPRVFVSRRIPDEGLDRILERCDADVWEGDLPPSRGELGRRVVGCDGILTLLTDSVDAELLDLAGPQLRVVSNYAVGVDNIDLSACADRGIAVGHTPGVLTEATADLAWTLLMASGRRLLESVDYVRAGRWVTWNPTLLRGAEIHGSTLGIIGFGRIGQAVARRAAGFGMRVLYNDVAGRMSGVEEALNAEFVPLDQLYAESDFISLHSNLTAESKGFIGASALAKMKPTVTLINTARGPIIDTDALVAALSDGTIARAALDVTDPEPLPIEHALHKLPNVLIVPHISSATYTTRARMATMAADNLLAGVAGRPLPNAVDLT
jgi:glyoxylate reductase